MNQNQLEERAVYLNGSLYNLDPSYTENIELDLMDRTKSITLIK